MNVNNPSYHLVHEALLHLLPGIAKIIRAPYYLTADTVLSALKQVGVEITLESIRPRPDESDINDDEIYKVVFEGHEDFHSGELLIETHACSGFDMENFRCESNKLKQFVHDYPGEYLQIFDHDAIFLAPSSRTITVVHHEAAFGHFRIPHL